MKNANTFLYGVVSNKIWFVASVERCSMAKPSVTVTGVQKAMNNLGSLIATLRDPRLLKLVSNRLKKILIGRIENKGSFVVNKVFKPNEPATVWRKGFDHPYIHTQELLKQIVSKKTSTGYFVGVEGSKAFVAAILEFGAQIQVTDKMRRWWAVNFPTPLSASTQRIIIPPRLLFTDIMGSTEVKNQLARELARYIIRRYRRG